MAKAMPAIMMMFAIVIGSLTMAAIASYWGTENWTWLAQQTASFVLLLITLGLAVFALVGWMRRR